MKMINIGTVERPIMVPEVASAPTDTVESRQFWNGVASGSIELPDDALDKLLERSGDGRQTKDN